VSIRPRVCLVSASCQNVFFAEILEAFGEALREAGMEVEASFDCFPPLSSDLVYLYIPHEFHSLVDELAHPSPAQMQRSIALCTEQPGTTWFEMTCQIAARAGAAVDINELGAQELRRRGIAAHNTPLGYVRSWDHWRRQERERSVDMAFLGGYTERRAEVLARCSQVLTGRKAAIYLTETGQPHVAGSAYFLSYERKWELMADTRVILNVHRGELPYLEWHRVLGAIANGCVVLSEQPLGAEPLCPGEHFVSARPQDMPWVMDALLEDPGRLRRIREAAYDLVREEMPMSRTAAPLFDAIERVAARPVGAAVGSATSLPLPRPLPPRLPAWELHAGHLDEDTLPMRMGLKHLIVGLRTLERRVSDLVQAEKPAGDRIEWFGPHLERPAVSVLLTVHNYVDHVGEALKSVALAEMPEVEVIAVDDGSSDGSVEAVELAAAELPWLPLKLIARGRNHGLPAARNLAFEHARADLVFVLDADNVVLRGGLQRLVEALDEHPGAAFAYGLIECFDSDGPCDVLNWMDWDPARLRHGNYIDAMAMVRRSALEEVGCYPLDPALFGWEDYAVWLAMASVGMQGVRVPDFVARYRRSSHSMISLTGIDTSAAWATLLRRYPKLNSPEGFRRVLDAETEPIRR
jgi:Glycosyl transferase family 2/Glycosyl transferases group 1